MMDGLITFFASHHAMRAERLLTLAGIPVRLIPGPREVSPSCGIALRFPLGSRGEVELHLTRGRVQVEQILSYPEGGRST